MILFLALLFAFILLLNGLWGWAIVIALLGLFAESMID